MPRRIRATAPRLGDVVCAEEKDNELVHRGEFLHEVPRILARAQSLVDEHCQLIRRFGPQQFEARASPWGVRTHPSSLTATLLR